MEATVLLGFSPLLFYASKGDYDHVEEMYGNWQSCSRVALSVWNWSIYIPHLRYLKWDRHTIPVALNHLSNCWLFSSLFHSVRVWLQNFLFRVWLAYFTTLNTAILFYSVSIKHDCLWWETFFGTVLRAKVWAYTPLQNDLRLLMKTISIEMRRLKSKLSLDKMQGRMDKC